MEQESNFGKNFVRTILPWIIGITAFIFYLATLNRWASVLNLESVARINGWNWVPDMHAPLYSVITYPLHWLSAGLVPVALNLFSALCAAIALGLLARSVALLPHNKTDAQRQHLKNPFGLLSISSAWLPLALAVVVCGLQLTFWDHATNGSPEMFDLLVFAYLVRCLLEYRIDQRETWLTRSAVIYGLGMTNNWALIGFFPLFITALIWMMGWKFFNTRFLIRMTLLGVAGLSLYLLLPLLQMFSHTVSLTFWQGLKGNILGQKIALFSIPRKTVLFLSLTSLVPIFFLSIRWPSYFGDPSPLGVALTTLIFHIAQALFLLACVWIAFDPQFGARFMYPMIPFLTFYYLAALSVGYFSGYFLLVFSKHDQRPERRRAPRWPIYVNFVINCAVWLVLAIATTGLFYKNSSIIRITNSSAMLDYSRSLTENIPPNAVVLSDDVTRLRLAEAALAKAGRVKNIIAIDTDAMKWPQYRKYLKMRYGANWTETVDPKRDTFIEDSEIVNTVNDLAGKYPVWYLNSSFGYYFEFFYAIPHGLAFELKKYDPKQISPPPLTDALITENDKFWKTARSTALPPLFAAIVPPPSSTNFVFRNYFMDELHLKAEPNITADYLGALYAQVLDNWGVELQKANRLDEANQYFTEAQQLSPNNVVVAINDHVNQTLRAGRKPTIESTKFIEDRFGGGSFSSWLQVMSQNGPFDDPTFCFVEARLFADGGLIRQPILLLTRVNELAPENFDARLLLARLYLHVKLPENALKLVSEIRSGSHVADFSSTNQTDLLAVESAGLFLQNKTSDAEHLISTALRENPDNAYLLNSLLHVSMDFENYADALIAADRLLRINPDDTGMLINKGYLHMQMGDLDAAILAFSHVLTLENNNYIAMLDRAISYLRLGKLDLAKKDYETIQKVFPDRFQVDFGLAEIAYRQHDTNAAIKNYEAYLAHTANITPESTNVIMRIKELKGEKP